MFTSIRVLNYTDFNELWVMSKINSYMSALGYKLTGTCEVPLQNEYIYDHESEEPSIDQLKNYLFQTVLGANLEIERYDINS